MQGRGHLFVRISRVTNKSSVDHRSLVIDLVPRFPTSSRIIASSESTSGGFENAGLSFCEYAIRHLQTRSHLRISRRVSGLLPSFTHESCAISTSETAS
jgi:hypothetical protein